MVKNPAWTVALAAAQKILWPGFMETGALLKSDVFRYALRQNGLRGRN
jgi:hypothetical protein